MPSAIDIAKLGSKRIRVHDSYDGDPLTIEVSCVVTGEAEQVFRQALHDGSDVTHEGIPLRHTRISGYNRHITSGDMEVHFRVKANTADEAYWVAVARVSSDARK